VIDVARVLVESSLGYLGTWDMRLVVCDSLEEGPMLIVMTICALFIMFAYEIRHRLAGERLTFLENEVHRLGREIKAIKEAMAQKEEAEKKAAAKHNLFRFFGGMDK
jgi:hypothetical protein